MSLNLIALTLLIVPILEIAVFIAVGGQVGIALTLALILVTAILGTLLLRIQGFAIIDRIRSELEANRLPGREMGNGAMILVAGVLLLTPGFVTDALGFLLFVPAVRNALWRLLATRLVFVDLSDPAARDRQRPHPDVVELDPEEYRSKPNPHSPWRDNDQS